VISAEPWSVKGGPDRDDRVTSRPAIGGGHFTDGEAAIMGRIVFQTAITLLVLATTGRSAQQGSSGDKIGWVPREILERPVALRSGIGKVHEPVTTSSPEAQAFYDQGLAYLHSYVWIEAARSFNRALRLDPRLAMAHLGLSYAYSGLEDDEAAGVALARAQAMASTVSSRERTRFEIRARQLAAIAEPSSLVRRDEYRDAINAALRTWPDDAELWILAGHAAESSPWGRGQRGSAVTIAFYEAALARARDHFAAHHYLTHTYETLGLADEALTHGREYARLAPTIAHAQHMYGHDLRRTGQIAEAVAHFEHTRRLEEGYFESEHIPPEYDWHYAHNLSLLATGYHYQGRLKAAESLHRRVFELPAFTPRFELFRREWVEFILGRGRPDEALNAVQEMHRSRWAAVRGVGHILAGQALLATGRGQDAMNEYRQAEREIAATDARGPLPVTRAMLQPHLDMLNAEILLRGGNRDAAGQLFDRIQEQLRAEAGADAWIGALFRLESIARIARQAGDWALAERAAHWMLEHDRSYAGAHYALALVLAQRGNRESARTEFATAVELWRLADADLPERRDAQEHLASDGRAR
jgi:tetratricopeptide (TPR) repeat protein